MNVSDYNNNNNNESYDQTVWPLTLVTGNSPLESFSPLNLLAGDPRSPLVGLQWQISSGEVSR